MFGRTASPPAVRCTPPPADNPADPNNVRLHEGVKGICADEFAASPRGMDSVPHTLMLNVRFPSQLSKGLDDLRAFRVYLDYDARVKYDPSVRDVVEEHHFSQAGLQRLHMCVHAGLAKYLAAPGESYFLVRTTPQHVAQHGYVKVGGHIVMDVYLTTRDMAQLYTALIRDTEFVDALLEAMGCTRGVTLTTPSGSVVVDLVARVFQAALGHLPPRSGLAALRLGSACYRERAADVLR